MVMAEDMARRLEVRNLHIQELSNRYHSELKQRLEITNHCRELKLLIGDLTDVLVKVVEGGIQTCPEEPLSLLDCKDCAREICMIYQCAKALEETLDLGFDIDGYEKIVEPRKE